MCKKILFPFVMVALIATAVVFNTNKLVVPTDYNDYFIANEENGLKAGLNEMTIDEYETMFQTDEDAVNKYMLYIGHDSCSDCNALKNDVMPDVLAKHDDIAIIYINFADYTNTIDDKEGYDKFRKYFGDKLAGSNTVSNPVYSSIKGLKFNYTPSFFMIYGNQSYEVFEGYGGGPLRSTRYFRNSDATDAEKAQGIKNGIADVDTFVTKWKKDGK